MNDAPQFIPKNRQDWRDWLEGNHRSSRGVWVVWHKKHTGKTAISYDEMVEEALCFGWIDSVPRKIDADLTSLYFSPRNPKSEWSLANKQRVAKLTEQKRIMPVGLQKIRDAQADGSWDILNNSDNLVVPDDLIIELKKYTNAKENFENFPPGATKNILAWIYAAKTEATRTKRVQETAQLANESLRANQWRPSK